jgi:ureidoglycolate lyase
MELVSERLTAEAFAAFGQVLDGSRSGIRRVNQGRATRTDLASLRAMAGEVVLARYDVTGSALPLDVTVLERHPRSDQSFVALDGASALIVLTGASPDGSPDLVRARAFIAGPETPFLYSAGTWHAPLFALGRGGGFLMAMHESGTPADCETFELQTALRVVR